MITAASPGDVFSLDDVKALHQIAPEVVVLRDTSVPHTDVLPFSSSPLQHDPNWVVDIVDPKSRAEQDATTKEDGSARARVRSAKLKIARCRDAFILQVNSILQKIREKDPEIQINTLTLTKVLSAAQSDQEPSVPNGAAKPPKVRNGVDQRHAVAPMDVDGFIRHLKSNNVPWIESQIVYEETLPARAARFASIDPALSSTCHAILSDRPQLYAHQAEATKHIIEGRHTVVATSTASGKSLCYALPIAHSIHQDASSTALLIFPTKALTQDQQASLRRMISSDLVSTFDGDTAVDEREALLKRGIRVMLTNPDMLSHTILPSHSRFSSFLKCLKYVVVDEVSIVYISFQYSD